MLAKPSEQTAIDQLATTWAIVEARPTVAALIAVVSATPVDDTEPVARGLARVAADAGNRTGYLYLGRGRSAPSDQSFAYTDLSPELRQPARASFDAALAGWRDAYDVLVFEIPQLASCPLGAHVARVADGTVIALFPDRRVRRADFELKGLLTQLNASIIGIVKTMAAHSSVAASPAPSRSLRSLFFPVRQP